MNEAEAGGRERSVPEAERQQRREELRQKYGGRIRFEGEKCSTGFVQDLKAAVRELVEDLGVEEGAASVVFDQLVAKHGYSPTKASNAIGTYLGKARGGLGLPSRGRSPAIYNFRALVEREAAKATEVSQGSANE